MAYRDAGNVSRAFEIHAYNVGNYLNYDSEYMMLSQVEIVCAYVIREEDELADTAFENLLTLFADKPELPKAILSVGHATWTQALVRQNSAEPGRGSGPGEAPDEHALEYFSKALDKFELIINSYSSSDAAAEAYYMAAECYCKFGQPLKAVEYFEQIVAKWPDYERAETILVKIARTYSNLARSGAIDITDADFLTRDAYERLAKNYPDSKWAREAQEWLSHIDQLRDQLRERGIR